MICIFFLQSIDTGAMHMVCGAVTYSCLVWSYMFFHIGVGTNNNQTRPALQYHPHCSHGHVEFFHG